VLARQEYVPASLNLGKVYYLQGDKKKALDIYTRVAQKEPQNPYALLGLAVINYGLEKFADAADFYLKLKQVDSGLAEKYSYLGKQGK
jgi:Tfp pilus assembly protein PilF